MTDPGKTQQWFTSDQHYGHRNIIAYCDRPFRDTNEMCEEFISAHNKAVRPGDVVYHLGDLFFHNALDDVEMASILARLHGTHYLIRGNHDYVDNWGPVVTDQFVWIELRKEISIKKQGPPGRHLRITLDHLPLESWYSRFGGALHLHGHTHDTLPPRPGRLDVSVDTAYRLLGEYRPFSLDEVLEHIDAKNYWETQLPILKAEGEGAFASAA